MKDFEEYKKIIINYFDNKYSYNYIDENALEEMEVIKNLQISQELHLFLGYLTQEERHMYFEMCYDICRYQIEKGKRKITSQQQQARCSQSQVSTSSEQQDTDSKLQQRVKELLLDKTHNILDENQQKISSSFQSQPSTSLQQQTKSSDLRQRTTKLVDKTPSIEQQPLMHSTPLNTNEIEFPEKLQTVPEGSTIEFPTLRSNVDDRNLLPPSNLTPLCSVPRPLPSVSNPSLFPRQLSKDQEIEFSIGQLDIAAASSTQRIKYPRVINPLPPETEDLDALFHLPYGVIQDISICREQQIPNDDPIVNELRELEASIKRQERPKAKQIKILNILKKNSNYCPVRSILEVWPMFDKVNDWTGYSQYQQNERNPIKYIEERMLNIATSINSDTLENLRLVNLFEQNRTPLTLSALQRQSVNIDTVISLNSNLQDEQISDRIIAKETEPMSQQPQQEQDDDIFMDLQQQDDDVTMTDTRQKGLTVKELEDILTKDDGNEDGHNGPSAAAVATEILQNVSVEPTDNREIDKHRNDRHWHEILRSNLPIINRYCEGTTTLRRRRQRRRQQRKRRQPTENIGDSENVSSRMQRIDVSRPVDQEQQQQQQQQQQQTETVDQSSTLPPPTYEPTITDYPNAEGNLENMEVDDDNANEIRTFHELLLQWKNSIFENATVDGIRKYLRTSKYDFRLLDDMDAFEETGKIMKLLITKECVIYEEIFPKTLNRREAIKRFKIILEMKTRNIIKINKDNNGQIIDIKLNKNNDNDEDERGGRGGIVELEGEERREEERGHSDKNNDDRMPEELEREEEQGYDKENVVGEKTEEFEFQ